MSTRRTLVFPFAEDQFWVELVAEGRSKIRFLTTIFDMLPHSPELLQGIKNAWFNM